MQTACRKLMLATRTDVRTCRGGQHQAACPRICNPPATAVWLLGSQDSILLLTLQSVRESCLLQSPSSLPSRHHWQRFWLIAGLALFALGLGSVYDQELTISLRGLGGPAFADFMGRSLFEGSAFGFGDIGTLSQVAVVALYLWGASQRWLKLRPELGFLGFSALFVGLLVQSLKVLLARPRPGGEFQPFWQISSTAPERLFGTGSFPSGHTAQIALLLGFVYVWRRASPAWRRGLSALILLAAATMGLSRIVSFKHWLTDTMGSVFLCWLALHWTYYVGLKIPEQGWYLQRSGTLPATWPRVWELELVAWSGLVMIGAAMAAAMWRGGYGWGGLLPAVAVVVGALMFTKRRRHVLAALGVGET